MRANLLRSVSHDIRTPLTAIMGLSATVEESETLTDEGRGMVEEIHQNAQWLLHLSENILSVTRFCDEGVVIEKSDEVVEEIVGSIYDESGTVHQIHRCKLDAFDELIDALDGQKALVFYGFRFDEEQLTETLKAHHRGLRFAVLDNEHDVAAWNTGELDVLLAQPASCAYGLNLQQGGNHVIWFGLTWNYELYTQANKRLHRQGQEEKVIIHHLVSSGTRDEDVMLALEKKDDVQNWVMESLKARIRKIRQEV